MFSCKSLFRFDQLEPLQAEPIPFWHYIIVWAFLHFLFSAHSATSQLQPWDLPFLQAWLLVVENATWKLTHGLATPLPFLVAQMIKNLPAVQETWVRSLGWKDPLEKGMSTHSSILAWEIAWAEEPVRLQSMESQRVGYDWAQTHAQHSHLRLSAYVETMTATNIFNFKSALNGSF